MAMGSECNRLSVQLVDGRSADFVVFQRADYISKEGKIIVKVGEDFKAALVEFKHQNGKKVYLDSVSVIQMDSKYTKKYYPILLERIHRNEKDRMIFAAAGSLKNQEFDRIEPLDRFRELLCIPESYKIDHIKDICNTIEQEINAFTTYKAKAYYNIVPGGRYGKVTHICWIMEEDNKASEKGTDATDSDDDIPGQITIMDEVSAVKTKTESRIKLENELCKRGIYADDDGRNAPDEAMMDALAIQQKIKDAIKKSFPRLRSERGIDKAVFAALKVGSTEEDLINNGKAWEEYAAQTQIKGIEGSVIKAITDNWYPNERGPAPVERKERNIKRATQTPFAGFSQRQYDEDEEGHSELMDILTANGTIASASEEERAEARARLPYWEARKVQRQNEK